MKLRARELAHAVALNYVIIVDAAHQLSEWGNAPGVMSEQVHKVFTTVASEIDDLILQRKDEAMPALLNGAIELRRGRGKCLSHLQKALRHDLRTCENRGMVDERGFEPPASSLRTGNH
jgi:hypothetical protein